jgi:outer membrane protein
MRILSLTKQATLNAVGLVLMAACAGSVFAQNADAPKIAVLDMGGALFNSERAKVVDAQLTETTAGDTERARALAAEGTELQQKLQRDAAVMSEDEKRKANERIEEISVQYQLIVERLQGQATQVREQFQNTHAQALIQAIQAVIEEGGYDIVLRAEAALHVDAPYDITARVTEKLNQQP